MSVPNGMVEYARGAAEVLDEAPVSMVYTGVPALDNSNVLHPLIGPVGHIDLPFTFHKFGLAITKSDRQGAIIRLTPPENKTVGVPIERDAETGSPRIDLSATHLGFSALSIHLEPAEDGRSPFLLFGERPVTGSKHELDMPSEWSEEKIIEVVSGLVIAKSTAAILQKGRETRA